MIIYIHPQLGQTKTFFEFVQSSKNIIDVDSDDENEMNNIAPVPTSSKMRNNVKNMRRYLDAHSNGEKNTKICDSNNLLTI
ncbi:hypothetical protein TNCV_1007571 [Trichonephila clavipes]|nr:hypothetical protein TNCV_1007571 [Trichonephila clavipes]